MVVVIHETRAVMVWRGFTGDNVRIFSETKTMGMGCESLLIPVGTESWSMWSEHVFSHISCTWVTPGTKMHYGKKASWWGQCDALGNVRLGNQGSCRPCGCYFDKYHLTIVAEHVHPFIETVFTDGRVLFQQDNIPCQRASTVQERFEVLTWHSKLARSQPSQTSVGRKCAVQTCLIGGSPTSQLRRLKGSVVNFLVQDATADLPVVSNWIHILKV